MQNWLLLKILQNGLQAWHDWQSRRATDLTEMIFEHREKAYGAYQLRRNYNWHCITALMTVSSLSVAILFFWINDRPEPNNDAISYPLANCIPPPSLTWHNCIKQVASEQTEPEVNIINTDTWENFYAYWPYPVSDCTVIHPRTIPDHNDFVPVDTEPEIINLVEIFEGNICPSTCNKSIIVERILVSPSGIPLRYVCLNEGSIPAARKKLENLLPHFRFIPAFHRKYPVYYWVNIPFILCGLKH